MYQPSVPIPVELLKIPKEGRGRDPRSQEQKLIESLEPRKIL